MSYTKWELKYLLVAPFTILLILWFAVGMKFRDNRIAVVLIGYPFWLYDLIYNFTVASFLWGFPEKGDWLVTDRLKKAVKTKDNLYGYHRFIQVANENDEGHV